MDRQLDDNNNYQKLVSHDSRVFWLIEWNVNNVTDFFIAAKFATDIVTDFLFMKSFGLSALYVADVTHLHFVFSEIPQQLQPLR